MEEFLTFSWDNCKTLNVPRLTTAKPVGYGIMITRAYLYGMLAKCQALWQATVVHFLILSSYNPKRKVLLLSIVCK